VRGIDLRMRRQQDGKLGPDGLDQRYWLESHG
jgi:hypothetical protein